MTLTLDSDHRIVGIAYGDAGRYPNPPSSFDENEMHNWKFDNNQYTYDPIPEDTSVAAQIASQTLEERISMLEACILEMSESIYGE